MSEEGLVLWFTGRPGSGKTSIVNQVYHILKKYNKAEILDGDELRKWLSPEAGFSRDDRERHINRVIGICSILSRNGIIVFVALVSPYRKIREEARKILGKNFKEIYVKCSIETCMKRDPKGHYKLALKGEIKEMTGIQDPYEEPIDPDLIIDTEAQAIEESVQLVLDFIERVEPK
ncbi:putative adenylyl-sulfate kinase [Nitrosotalea devaniterrae]|uniref:Adenylyl-sulfate kinase n=1 Tax=Nitrosotalea devaniterrae TaxID=1078905 RepID=A0A128A0P7_9ARCH|nr:putative adenylyl-sulfate kinase [Candidatus Nitrosotalea devanaterra]